MVPHPGNALLLALLLVCSIWAIAGAKAIWKLFNFLIILAFMGIALLLAYLAGILVEDGELVGRLAPPLMYLFGACAAYVCVGRNRVRNTKP